MHPYVHAANTPDKAAYIMASTGLVVTYRQLDERSNQIAHLFRDLGLTRGDVIALLSETNLRYLEIAWAAQRTGLYYVCISSRLTQAEIEYIVKDCGAKVLIASLTLLPTAKQVAASGANELKTLFVIDGVDADTQSLEIAAASLPEALRRCTTQRRCGSPWTRTDWAARSS
jgi:long-chain acyl-CoA synthetase